MRENEHRFRAVLQPGQRVVGEWLAQAHGTRYQLTHEPFVVFDLMEGERRLPYAEVEKLWDHFKLATVVHRGGSFSVDAALLQLGNYGLHGAIDPVEGAVWRVERKGEFDFMAKYVRPDKVDGLYLPEVSGAKAIWNWRPKC